MRLMPAILLALAMPCAVDAQAPNLERMDIVLKSVPDGPVAKVQGENIERGEFVRFYSSELERLMRDNNTVDVPDLARAELAQLCLATLVERRLLHQLAVERELSVPDESVEKAWRTQLTQVQEMLKRREGREFSEEEVLRTLGYGSVSEVMEDIEYALLTEKMRATVIRESGLTVEEADVKRIVEEERAKLSRPDQLHLKQIFINPENHDTLADARKAAEAALGKVYSGQTFESVASALSNSPDRRNGGDMGMLPVSALPPFMVKCAESLQPGDITEVVESEFGFHVLQLVGRQSGANISIEEATPIIRRQLMTQEGTRVVHEYCDQLINDGAEVKVFLALDRNLALTLRLKEGEHE